MTHSLTKDFPHLLLNSQQAPCISLYQPTHRTHPDNAKDVIRFKNLVKELEEKLKSDYSNGEIKQLLSPFYELSDDFDFWQHCHEGLCILRTNTFFRVYKLPREVPKLTIVSYHFHIKPLIRIMQSADRFQLLALNLKEVKLYEGNRDYLEQVTLAPEVPKTLIEALGEELTEPRLTVATYGMGTAGPAMHHGHGGRKDDKKLDAIKYFRKVDKEIYKHHSRQSGLPLVLAALKEHHHLFFEISHNPLLMDKALDLGVNGQSNESLRKRAWQLLEPDYQNKINELSKQLELAKAKDSGSDNL